MSTTQKSRLGKQSSFILIAGIIAIVMLQAFVRKTLPPQSSVSSTRLWLDLFLNVLLSFFLFQLYIKKYAPEALRKAFMAVFFLELVCGIFLKKLSIPYSNEIVFIGFIGILVTWINTHLHRKKFPPKEAQP